MPLLFAKRYTILNKVIAKIEQFQQENSDARQGKNGNGNGQSSPEAKGSNSHIVWHLYQCVFLGMSGLLSHSRKVSEKVSHDNKDFHINKEW